jgi:CheY-like chemotaxis protein
VSAFLTFVRASNSDFGASLDLARYLLLSTLMHGLRKRDLPDGPLLMVDDDPDAIELFQHAARRAGLQRDIHVATDGLAAIGQLRLGLGRRPAVLLLDLEMPHLDGLGVLRWLRRSEAYRDLTVVVMSAAGPQAGLEAYAAGADAFIAKPDTFKGLVRVAELLVEPTPQPVEAQPPQSRVA